MILIKGGNPQALYSPPADMSITRRERKRKGVKNMAQNQIEIYAAEKRLQLLLNKKFEMLEKLHPFLLGEPRETVTRYEKVFDEIDGVIQQEIKYLDGF